MKYKSVFIIVYLLIKISISAAGFYIKDIDPDGYRSDAWKYYSSLAIDSNCCTHFSYGGNSGLKYAKYDGVSFSTITIESGSVDLKNVRKTYFLKIIFLDFIIKTL